MSMALPNIASIATERQPSLEIDLGGPVVLVRGADSKTADMLSRAFDATYPIRLEQARRGHGHTVDITTVFANESTTYYALTVDRTELLRHASHDLLMQILFSNMCDLAWRAHEQTTLLIHAGAVGIGDCGILIPGSSYAGKSTTSAILSLAGFDCYTDDAAMVDDEMTLGRLQKPIMLRRGGWEVIHALYSKGAENRLIWGQEGMDVWYLGMAGNDAQAVEHPRRRARLILQPFRDADAPTLLGISRGEVFGDLVEQCLSMGSDKASSIGKIAQMVDGADGYWINMHDPKKAVEAVTRLAEGS